MSKTQIRLNEPIAIAVKQSAEKNCRSISQEVNFLLSVLLKKNMTRK